MFTDFAETSDSCFINQEEDISRLFSSCRADHSTILELYTFISKFRHSGGDGYCESLMN